ncbi:MAG: hypothetical protein ACYDAY_11925 [Candidatus Dormibacteria bacterium]
MSRWVNLVIGGDRLLAADVSVPLSAFPTVAAAARYLKPGPPRIVWFPPGFPRERLHQEQEDRRGAHGWTSVGAPSVLFAPRADPLFCHLADPRAFLAAVELFGEAVGRSYAYSAPATLHRALASGSCAGLPPAGPEPALGGRYEPTLYAGPTFAWSVTPDGDSGAYVRAFDRSGSFLSAWSGCPLPVEGKEGWQESDAGWFPSKAKLDKGGYYLIEPPRWLLSLRPNPLPRRMPGPAWITTPILQLLLDLTPDSGMRVLHSWTCDTARLLDPLALRLRDGREMLQAEPGRAAAAALDALKDGYAGATAWFEYSAGSLSRPVWRRTILDRYVANTCRRLYRMRPTPFAVTDVDTAFFALPKKETIPLGMVIGKQLGQWKPKGRAIPMGDALKAMAAGGTRRLSESCGS